MKEPKVVKVPIGVTGEELSGKPLQIRRYTSNGGKAGAMASKDRARRKKEQKK